MKVKLVNRKILPVVFLGLVMAACGIFLLNNMKLKNNLKAEKLQSEKLLSEKLSVDKTLVHIQQNVRNLQAKNASLDKMIADSKKKIEDKNIEINQLKAQHASIKDMKNKVAELESLKQQLNLEIASLNTSLKQTKEQNSKLSDQIASFSKANSGLANDNSILQAMISDNYRVEAFRGKQQKLTINSRQTNKLQVSFDLPGNAKNDIYFKVVTPRGDEFSSNTNLSASIRITEIGDGLLASSNPSEIGSAGTKRVEMTYKPTHKLTKGIYQFNIYNGDRFLGSTQLHLK